MNRSCSRYCLAEFEESIVRVVRHARKHHAASAVSDRGRRTPITLFRRSFVCMPASWTASCFARIHLTAYVAYVLFHHGCTSAASHLQAQEHAGCWQEERPVRKDLAHFWPDLWSAGLDIQRPQLYACERGAPCLLKLEGMNAHVVGIRTAFTSSTWLNSSAYSSQLSKNMETTHVPSSMIS